ncbi:transposase [Pseudomonas stutzeri]|nr:transposase [Stutzerimonas stutzeri]
MRQRSSYPKPFKVQVVQECLQPGATVSSVAIRHGINANVIRKWQALNSCACNQDADTDGCYRCVYRYHNSHDRKSISRNTAQKLLGEVVQHKGSLKPVTHLADTKPGNQLLDSMLEKRFVEVLRRECQGPPRQDSCRVS